MKEILCGLITALIGVWLAFNDKLPIFMGKGSAETILGKPLCVSAGIALIVLGILTFTFDIQLFKSKRG